MNATGNVVLFYMAKTKFLSLPLLNFSTVMLSLKRGGNNLGKFMCFTK